MRTPNKMGRDFSTAFCRVRKGLVPSSNWA